MPEEGVLETNNHGNRPWIAVAIIAAVLILDQSLKVWIKTNMYMGEEFSVMGNWFIIHFTENPGMAFGLEFGGDIGKILLSVFRIIAVSAIGYFLFTYAKKGAKTGLLVAGGFIFAGALGNILDSAFYGLMFDSSWHQVAEFMPANGGYADFLYGNVVDMLYFPLFNGTFPEWFPLWGGEDFLFFRPVFNVADAAITTGIAMIVIFQKRFFEDESSKSEIAAPDSTID
ncbi:MAG TPA: lipoprotein signal peptidase [Flavobacteriales bacterium]|jgi:signal peptidase II|nr:lipoprotein signal peptidase [Flavobacteriales bacterium]